MAFRRLVIALVAAAAGAVGVAVSQDGRISYPVTRRIHQIDTLHGTNVEDPYRWLEADIHTSKEITEWVADQNKITAAFLADIPEREPIKRRLTELWNYEKTSPPYQVAGRFYVFSHNDGLQNHDVVYTTETPDAEPQVLLDPNTWTKDGTAALAGTAFSADGKYLAHGVAQSGSDWTSWKVLEIASRRPLADELKWIKFSGVSWAADSTGFFYSSYPEPKPGEKYQAIPRHQKVFYHRLGKLQSDDVLVYERPDQPNWLVGARATSDGQYLVIRLSEGGSSRNVGFVPTLPLASAENARPRRGPFTVVWHAGEPLVLPPAFYEEAFALLDRHNAARVPVHHSFQTNAILIDHAWADFIKARDLRIGVSVDGPAFLHDRFRKTRKGTGTLERVIEGMHRLRERGVPFHVITVLTRASLDYPDELFDFYQSQGIGRVGFNIEEIEGPNTSSSLSAPSARSALERFLSRFYDLAERAAPSLYVREFESMRGALLHSSGRPPLDHQSTPLAILSVDCEGNFSTFSPELLGLPSTHYDGFALGNILTHSLADTLVSPRLQAMEGDIRAGIERCRTTCAYFNYCGGGAPVNKYFENGSFDSTETMFSRLGRQAVVDVVLAKLERQPVQAVS
jgi:radical SAM/SPASM domain protein of GRRM system